MANENRLKLFNALGKAGYDIGSYDDFDRRMNNPEDREKFYNAIGEAGYDIGDRDEFERRISPTKYKFTIDGKEVGVSEKEYKDYVNRHKPDYQQTLDDVQQTLRENQRTINRIGNQQQRIGLDTGKPVQIGGNDPYRLGQNRKVTKGEKRLNPETGQLEDTYITESGNEYESREMADLEQNAVDQAEWERNNPKQAIKNNIDSQIKNIESRMSGYEGQWVDADGRVHYSGGSAGDEAMRNLENARHDLMEARQQMERTEQLQKSSDFLGGIGIPFTKDFFNNWKNFGYAVWDKLSDIGWWEDALTGGVNDLEKAGAYMKIKNKVDSGIPLTDQETDVVLSAMATAQAQQYVDLPMGYTAGEITADMAPFMAQMAVNPASGLGRGLARQAVRRYGRHGIGAVSKRVAARVLGNLGEAAVLSNTLQAPRTIGNAIQRYTGDSFVYDEDGNLHMGHYEDDENGEPVFVEGGDNALSAAYKGEVSSIIENFTELGFGGNVNKFVKKMATSKAGRALGIDYLSDLVGKVGTTPFAKNMKKFMERTHWDGMIEEPLEEEYGIILNAFLGTGDNKISDLWDSEQQAQIFAGTLWFGGMMSAMNTAAYPLYRRRLNQQVAQADTNGQIAFGDEWEVMKDAINMMDDKDIGNYLYSIKDNDAFSNEQKAALFGYAARLKQQQGANVADMLMRMEGNLGDVEKAERAAYDAGAEAETADEKKKFVEDAVKSELNLFDYGKEFATMITAQSDDPANTIDYLLSRRDIYTDEQIAAASDYYQKQARAAGVMDAAEDAINTEVERANAEVRANTHQDTGSIVTVQSGDVPYYVIGGEIVDDGNGNVLLSGTGGAMVVKNALTGEVSVMSPQEMTVVSVQNADDLIQQNETVLREQLIKQADDDITYGSPANEVFDMEDTVALQDGQGGVIEGQIVGLPNAVDGVFVVQTNDGRALQMTADEMNRRIVGHNGVEVQRGMQPEQTGTQNLAAEPQGTVQGAGLNNAVGEQSLAQGRSEESNPQQSALSKIPVRMDAEGKPMKGKNGRPILDWHKASVEDAAAALVETTGGDKVMARDTATDLVKNEQARLEKIRKQEPKGDDPIEIAESRVAIRKQEQEQQAIIKHWKDVNQLIQQQMRDEQEQAVREREAAKSEEQRQREAEEARIRQEQQDEQDRQRLREQIEKDKKLRNQEYQPLTQAKKELAGDSDALSVLDDVEPRGLDEWVSYLLRPHSILWKDASDAETGLQTELGLKRGDLQRMMSVVGTSESGAQPFNKIVMEIHEGLPDAMKEQYTDQDVRNTLLGLFAEGSSARMLHLTEEHRIEEAREAVAETERREADADMEAWCEFYHLTPEERETFEEFMQQAPTEPEQEVINNIIAEHAERQSNGASPSVGEQPVGGGVPAGVEGGQGQVQGAVEAADNGINAEAVEEGSEASGGEPAVSGDQVAGGTQGVERSREALRVMFDQIGADVILADRMSDYEVEQLTAMVEDWDDYNDKYGQVIEEQKDNLKSKNKNVRDAAQAAIDTAQSWANQAFEPIQMYIEELNAKYGIEKEEPFEGAIPTPKIDMPRYMAIRQALVEGYRSGDKDAIQAAAQQMQAYVDEGLDHEGTQTDVFDIAEEYNGNDPEMLADQYIIRTYWDRYLDDDADQEYIKTGLKPNMREVAPSEQLKPVDLRDAVRPESAELGVNEANARAKRVDKVQNDVDELSKKYRSLTPIVVMDSENPTDEQLEDILGRKATAKELAEGREWLRNFKEPAFYSPFSKKTYIFADKIGDRTEESFFHENMHRWLENMENADEIFDAFWNASTSPTSEENKRSMERQYADQPEAIREEYMVNVFGVNMTKGKVGQLLDRLSPEHRKAIEEFLNEIRYDTTAEATARGAVKEEHLAGTEGKGVHSTSGTAEAGERLEPYSSFDELVADTDITVKDNERKAQLKAVVERIMKAGSTNRRISPRGVEYRFVYWAAGLKKAERTLLKPWANNYWVEDYDDAKAKTATWVDKREQAIYFIKYTPMGVRASDIEWIIVGKETLAAKPQGTVQPAADAAGVVEAPIGKTSSPEEIAQEEAKVDTNPTEGQKEAGNYQKGHINVDGYDITIENPKGSVRSGVDSKGNRWETTMRNTYGYIRGTEGVDGDHIDVFLSDNPASGSVFVVDQIDEHHEFDEHKVMYGFASEEEAREAYLSNYSEGWQGLGAITEVSRQDFAKWIKSSHRKTKPFAEYKSVKKPAGETAGTVVGLKKFFGDWEKDPENASKIVDEKGQPLVVYRGGELLDNIDDASSNAMYGKAFYATPYLSGAEEYAETRTGDKKNVQAVYLNVRKPFVDGWVDAFNHPNPASDEEINALVEALSKKGLKDPKGFLWKLNSGKIQGSILGNLASEEYKGLERPAGTWWPAADLVQEALKELGYDGVVGMYTGDVFRMPQVAVFDMNQVMDAKNPAGKPQDANELEGVAKTDGKKRNEPKTATAKKEKPAREHKRLVSDEKMEELKRRLLEKMSNLNEGLDMERMLIGAAYAAGKIERGVTKFADFCADMIADFGDNIREYLKLFYNGARDLPEAKDLRPLMDDAATVDKFDVFNFDKKGKVPTAIEKAEQVTKEQKVKRQAKKIKAEQGDLFAGDLFGDVSATEPQSTEQPTKKTGEPKYRPLTEADLDNDNPTVYYQGKPAHIVAVIRKGEQTSATSFSKPTVSSIMLTNGKSVQLSDLMVRDDVNGKPVEEPAEEPAGTVAKPKTPWWSDTNRPASIDPSDYRTYMTDEAKEYFASHPAFGEWKRKDLAFVTAAVWDGVVIPIEALKELPEIVEAEQIVKNATANGVLQISDKERDQHAQRLLDAEHGSAVFENGKIKKINGVEDFSGPVRQERKALVIIGYPAAGKSSVFANRLSNEQGARIIDSDTVKPWLKGFDGGNGAGYVQAASSEVAEQALDMAVGHGDNIIIPRIGGESVIMLSAALKLAGYDVQLYFNDVANVTSVNRATSRFAETGRYLSLDYLTSKDGVPSKNFSNFAKKKIGDYIYELSEGKVQQLRGRLRRLLESETVDGKRLWQSSAADQGGYSTLDEYLSVLLGTGGTGVASGSGDLIFSYAEWKSNDVAFGEKPKEIWNSKSGKPMSTNDNNNEGEQKIPGESSPVGGGTGQTSRPAGRAGAERSSEQDRAERSGSGHSVEENLAAKPQGTVQPAKPKQDLHKNKRNNVGERGKNYAPTSVKARFNANVEAIKMMRALMEDEVEAPTKDQMEVLRQYSGWGGLGTYFNDETSAENKLLRELLTEEEYNDAVMSINSAYYTPANVIDTLWDIAKAMGFKGGKTLEGSAGIGNIIGQMPQDMSRRSDIEAVEIDTVSGNILRLLYPDATVHIQGFQDTVIPNGSVDLAITNVPFVTGLHVIDKVDKDLSRRFTNIHDFCIAKNIRKLKEGGIGIFITSAGTMDKSNDLRAWITDEGNADVVGAFRLNNETFGGTKVTSDIIVVRKRTAGETAGTMAIDASKASPMRVGTYEDKWGEEKQVSMVVNDYFKEHPEMMAGEMAFGYEKGETFRPGSYGLYPVAGKDQDKMMQDFVKQMEKVGKTIEKPAANATGVVAEPNQLTAEKEGRMLIDDKGRLCVSERGQAVPLQLNAQKVKGYSKEQCFKDYQEVQQAVDDALQQQLNNPDDTALEPKLKALNAAFDKFVKRYGNLHKNTSIAFLRNDIDFPSFLALENYSETKDIKGKVTVTTRKAPIFKQRVLGFKTEPEPKTIKDAVIASIFRSNGIDLDWIAERLNHVAAPPNGDNWTTEDVRKGILISRLGFEDPSTGQLVVRYKYLSGNVREKLAIAEQYNASGETAGRYATNVEELRKVVPMDIPAHLIDFSLGSSWIPIQLYKDYLKETYDLPNVSLSHVEGSWILDEGYSFRNEKNRVAGVYSEKFRETIYGHQLVAAALNNRPVKVAKQVKEGWGSTATTKTVVDQAATQACAVRVDEIKEEFKQWAKKRMQDDPELAATIEKIYNEKFNALVPMEIGDEFLPEHFEGSNVNISLYGHQKRGVMRGVTAPTMLAHEVGTGKSFTLITTAMEMRRLGTAKKTMIVVQNATVAQMTADAKLLYPNAKVLSLSEKDRTAEGRRSFYAKIKFNDWDLIIVPQSTFERIPDSPERELQFIQEKIDEKKHVIEAASRSGMNSRDLSRLERELKALEQDYGDKYLDNSYEIVGNKKKKKDAKREAASLDKAETKAKEMLDRAVDDVQYFDDLGVDALLIDEAHEYKHLGFQTSIGRGIKGIDPSYSKKCAGLYNKTRCVFEKAGWKNVVFATGTPISNTAAEIWTFMKYLMPADVMRENDIYYFDDFVHNFGSISQMLEFATSGKFKENTRFAAYVNKPELIRIWSQVADTVLTKDVGAVNEKIPEEEGGKDQDMFLPQSPSLIRIMAAVRAELERFENMTGQEKKENSSIPLTMYGIAKRAAIDPRLVDAGAPDEPMSKTNAAVKEIVKDLEATKEYKGTVAVFCDNQNRLGKTADGKSTVEFNIYDDMREKLIKAGVPAEQIAIIKSGMSIVAKQKVFDAVNSGDIRVVLGSTQTLGTGVNMQERLHLLIHMDAPDRPMDYTQRNGRIKRQGNLHKQWGKSIRVIRFGVEDSLDVTAYQRLKTKSGFIDSIMDGKGALKNNQVDRTVEEEEEGLFDNPVAVLSGSQYALKKNQAERELRKYQGKKAQWEADQVYVTNQLRHNKNEVEADQNLIRGNEQELAQIKKMFPDGTVKVATVEGVKVDLTKDDGAKKLNEAIKEKINDPVNAIVKRNRENPIYNDETLNYTIDLDGHPVNFKVEVVREAEHENGRIKTVIHKFTSYSCPDLHIETSGSSRSVKDYLDEIMEQVVTGQDYQDRIDALQASIERINRESEKLQQRVGLEFQFGKELEEAQKHVEEYTQLMKKEMEEKEAKYAAQQKEASKDGGFDLHKAEDSEEDEDLYSAEEDWDDTKTEAFKNYFGDWENDPDNASKVVDAEGRPLVVYHGTNLTKNNGSVPFYVFEPYSHFGTRGQSKYRQEGEAMMQMEMAVEHGEPAPLTMTKTYPVYLNIRNPKRVEDVPWDWDESHNKWWSMQIYLAVREGYDGIVYLNEYEDKEHPADSWIAFYPEQVKSAVENAGSYDPNVRDIRYRDFEVFSDGERFPIHVTFGYSSFDVTGRSTSYSTDLMPDTYTSERQLLEAVRRQHPAYYVHIEDGQLVMDSWKSVMKSADVAVTQQHAKQAKAHESYIKRKTRNAINAVESMAKVMGLDVEVLTSTEGLTGKKARAKGWFNPNTHKIVLVLPNHVNQSDLINTLLHEGVAHYGLRKMFGPSFDVFLDNVYNNVSPEIKARIDAAMKRNGWSKHTATEEYLARLAERTDFEHATEQGWWQKIKDFFLGMLAKPGFSMELSDNDLRYILWRSYDNLLHPDSRRNIFDKAREVEMQRKLNVRRTRERRRLQATGRTDTNWIVAEADKVNKETLNRDYDGMSSKELLLSLSQKDDYERNETINELIRRVRAGNARIVRMGREMEYFQGSDAQIAGSIVGGWQLGLASLADETLGSVVHGESTLEGRPASERSSSPSDSQLAIISWAKATGHYYSEEQVKEQSLDKDVWRSAAESRVYRTADGKKVIKFMESWVYFQNPLLKRMDDITLQNASGFEPLTVLGYSEDEYGKLQVVLEQNYVDGVTVDEIFYDEPLIRENDYIDAFMEEELGLVRHINKEGNLYHMKDGLIYKDFHGGNILVDKDNKRHVIDCYVSLEGDDKKERTGTFTIEDSEPELFSIRTKEPPKKTGKGYKVFVLKDGQLYPPMVANPNGEGTPVGVWLDADAAPVVATGKTGRKKVKAGGKGTQGGSGQLAYRPGWHLGTIPYALQFNRGEKVDNPLGITNKKGEVIKVGKYFPNDFVWAEVEYAADEDYQKEAESYGYNESGNYQPSLAGLPRIPIDGSYEYRTNPNPATDPWIITGAMRVTKILSREEVDELVKKAGRKPQELQPAADAAGVVAMQEAIKELNAEIKAMMEADEMGLLMRDDDAWTDDVAQETYEKEVVKKSLEWQEAWQDSMASLKAIQDAIAKETGNVATGAEDAYRYENRMHGKAKNMAERYDAQYYRPMLKSFYDFCKQQGLTVQQGMDYLVGKSGLERNQYYAFRDAMKQKLAEDIEKQRDKLEKDYAKGIIDEGTYKYEKSELEKQEREGVDDAIKQLHEDPEWTQAKEDYDKGDINYEQLLERREQLMRNAVGGYYDVHNKDYSGLTETFAKTLYDDAQEIKKQAQRTIDREEKRELWRAYDEAMRIAYESAKAFATDAVTACEKTPAGETAGTVAKLWSKINAATEETLKESYENGLMDRATYNKVRAMFDYYVPLRGWDEDKASDVYTYMGKENVFSPAVKKTWGRTSKAENPLAYIGNIAISTILSGERNQMKQHFLNYVMNNPTSLVSVSESWYENIGNEGDRPVWVLRSADTAGKSGDELADAVNDFNEEMRLKARDGKAIPVTGRLRLDVHATQGQKAEHVVEVQRAGHTYQLYINGNPKAAQALNGSAARAVSRISDTWLGKLITNINRSMAQFFTSKNPAFVVSNLSRDLNMAGASVAVNEGAEYNARFIANVAKVLSPRLATGDVSKLGMLGLVGRGRGVTGLMPKLMRKYQEGKLNERNETERLFKEFMDEGGETGFVNMLSIDSFKRKMQREIEQMNGSSLFGRSGASPYGDKVKEVSVLKALRLLGDTFEFYNRCAEDATRFIVYMTSRQMGKTLEESIADAKDVTLNFNRKGTGAKGNAELRDLFIFVNPAIQALANMYRMLKGYPLKLGAVTAAFVTVGALMPIINQWLLNMFGDDDDKDAYWNLPPWVRKNNLVMWMPGTKNFVTIPLAQEFRVFYGVGEMASSLAMEHPVDKWGLEIFSSVADLVPINPTGNGGNLMVDFAPTMVQPLMQIGENIDFTGKPIWRENQGNKYAPMYTKAYVTTPRWMTKVSEGINDLTGGNEGKKGVVEKYSPIWGDYINNPAVWNHLLQGYFGGMYNTVAKAFDVGVTAASGEMPKVYQTPVINRFLNRPVERDNAGVLGEDYYNLKEQRDALQYELKVWQKKANETPAGDAAGTVAQEHVDEILNSDDWKRAEVITHYERIIKELKAGEQAATEKEDKQDIKRSISLYKQQMMEELAAIDGGKEPLDAAMEQYRNTKSLSEKKKLKLRIERLTNGSKPKVSDSKKAVEKALSYQLDDEARQKTDGSSGDKYLELATAENVRDDARIKAAKALIKPYTEHYKELTNDNKTAEAAKYRKDNEKWFAANQSIGSHERAIAENRKLLGKGNDTAIMKIIDIHRKAMLRAIEQLE